MNEWTKAHGMDQCNVSIVERVGTENYKRYIDYIEAIYIWGCLIISLAQPSLIMVKIETFDQKVLLGCFC